MVKGRWKELDSDWRGFGDFLFTSESKSLCGLGLPSEFIWGLPLYGVNFGFGSLKLVKCNFY